MNCDLSQALGVKTTTHFDFGENWKSFSDSALTSERVALARTDFHELMNNVPLAGRTFLDIGFGQGLAICLAKEAGAKPFGNDINPKCIEALKSTARFFPNVDLNSIPILVGSILDEGVLLRLKNLPPTGETRFDVVHSWGALHHTGAMKSALRHAASLVEPGGFFVLAIYNTHWSSPIWSVIKWTYAYAPSIIQRIFVALLFPMIFIAKLAVSRGNPLRKERGMSFYHDVVDWVGGYPYEHATIEEVQIFLGKSGFQMERAIPATVPTGCNQFVFRAPSISPVADSSRDG